MSNRTAFRYGALPEGALLAGYRVEQQIGRGGMAIIYRAYDLRLDRRVALKVLSPDAAIGDGFRRRFIRESRAAAAVDHPHIVPIHEAGEADGVLYIAMRYVQSGDLSALLERHGALPAAAACDIVSQVASALDAAHLYGLVHRDVKPANILLDSPAGGERAVHAYLADFGVTNRLLSRGTQASRGGREFVGTPRYAAPEQIDGGRVDGRADQYSLACTAYQMLCGTPPFGDVNGAAVLWGQMYEPPPPITSIRPGLPPSLDQVFAVALAKSPRDRYPACLDFAAALRQACGLAEPPAPAATSRPGQGGASAGLAAGREATLPSRTAATAQAPTRRRGRGPAGPPDGPPRSAGGPGGRPVYLLVAVIAVTVVVAVAVVGSMMRYGPGARPAHPPPAGRGAGPAAAAGYRGGDVGPGCPVVAASSAAAATRGGDGWIRIGGGPAACGGEALASRKTGDPAVTQDAFTWTFQIGHPAACTADVFVADANPSSGLAHYEVFAVSRLPIARFDVVQGRSKGQWVAEGPWRVPGGVLQIQLTDRAAFQGDLNHVTASAARATCR